MKTTCPNCGAPIEFRYDDSFVRVCSHCNNAVLRTDRGVDSLGKVADLVPMESPLRLFAEGHFGSSSFLLVGMAQIRHEAGGVWQEWYAKFDGGKWGWLAEAQGRYYLTFEEPWLAAPKDATPGEVIDVPVRGKSHPCTVGEVTRASYIAATGELPFKLVPNGAFRYADLSDGRGTFATIDFGDGNEPPSLYVGVQVPLEDLKISGGEVAPPAEATIKSQRLACPNCNAPVDLRAPGQSLRAVCGHCNALLDTSTGNLAVLGALATKAQPRIPLGAKGTFVDGELTVIGYVQRSAFVDGAWWPFDEYLLYRPNLGFRWLVESDGHWSYVQPIATGAVESTVEGAKYDGVTFRRYQQAQLRVDQVLGEFYWQVQQGETVDSEDSIAPPAMVSRESTGSEDNWSLGTYMSARELQKAFGGLDIAVTPTGIAPNQPDTWKAASGVMSIAFIALIALGLVFAMAAKDEQKYHHDFTIAGNGTSTTPIATSPVVTKADPSSVPECVEYKALLDAAMSCDAIADTRQILNDLYASTVATNDRDILQLSCKAGIDSVRAMASGCKLPDHDAIFAKASGSDAGSGSGSGAGSAADNAFFSDPIQLDGGRNVELLFDAPALDNNWAYVSADLVEEASGQIVSVDSEMEHYSGVDDGESWSEGSRDAHEVIGPQHGGSYILRIEGQYGGGGQLSASVTVKQGVFRGKYLAWAMLFLGIPLLLVGLVSWSHEKKRWENSTTGKAPVTPVSILVLAFVGIFMALGALLKAFAESSSDDD